MEKAEVNNGFKTSVPIESGSMKKKSISPGKDQNCTNAQDNLPKRSVCGINKPLIPLKLTLFLWFGAAAVLQPFIGLHLKQLGLRVENLAMIYMISPLCTFTGITVSGIIADKIGYSKPVLQAHLILAIITASSMLFIPELKPPICNEEIYCHSEAIDTMRMTTHCSVRSNNSRAFNCSVHCSFGTKDFCIQNYISACSLLLKYNLSLSTDRFQYKMFEECFEELPVQDNATNDLWCPNHKVKNCSWICKENLNGPNEKDLCKSDEEQKKIFALSFVLLTSFTTFFSCCYRIVDVTCMSVIKIYNSDYGTQRMWAILGLVIFAPTSGYVIALASADHEKQRYDVAFYIFDVMALLTICAVWRLDVKIDLPAKDMLKKTANLLKNFDITVFLAVVLVIGATWGFQIRFYTWYLEELHAPSYLIGLVSTVSGLLGLPFLLTSKWFVAKLGSSNLLLLALLGHAGFCTSYSFLQDPWWSLPCEAFGILTYHLLWVTVVTHTYEVAPPGLTAAVLSVAGGIHFNLGIGIGSLIGGFVWSKYGGRFAFRLMAMICVGTSALYAFYILCKRRNWKKELNLEKKENVISEAQELPERFIPHLVM